MTSLETIHTHLLSQFKDISRANVPERMMLMSANRLNPKDHVATSEAILLGA